MKRKVVRKSKLRPSVLKRVKAQPGKLTRLSADDATLLVVLSPRSKLPSHIRERMLEIVEVQRKKPSRQAYAAAKILAQATPATAAKSKSKLVRSAWRWGELATPQKISVKTIADTRNTVSKDFPPIERFLKVG